MSRCREATKDVVGCDKPGAGAEQPLIPGFPNGATRQAMAECIGHVKLTQGTETSKYLQERKSTETP